APLRAGVLLLGALCVTPAALAQGGAGNGDENAAGGWEVPRLPDGRPDLQGAWTNKTITPFERPEALGNQAFFTPEEAQAFVESTLERGDQDNRGEGVRDV